MIYLDNAATSKFKPKKAIKVFVKSAKNCCNATRSSHKLSLKMGEKVFETRENISKFFNLSKSNNVIFTSGCTESLNIAILGTAKRNGHIIVSTFEHNSVLRVLEKLKKEKNISYSIISPQNGLITTNDIKKLITNNTYMIIINHISNVCGLEQNITEIGKLCKKYNFIFLVDGAQSCGHVKIDMQKSNINLLSVACHKGMLGFQGLGLLLIENCNVNPIKFGGTGTNSEVLEMPNSYPDKLECGTLPSNLIISFNASLKYVKNNFNKINNKIKNLSNLLYDELLKNKNIIIYSNKNDNGVISFNYNNVDSNEFNDYLSSKNICVRNGLHCAPFAHKYLGTYPFGCIRISIGFNNSKKDIKKLIKVINKYKK